MNQGLLQVEACVIQGPIANDSGEFVSKVSAHDKKQTAIAQESCCRKKG